VAKIVAHVAFLDTTYLYTGSQCIDDMCECLITNLKRHFCLWQNYTNAHIP